MLKGVKTYLMVCNMIYKKYIYKKLIFVWWLLCPLALFSAHRGYSGYSHYQHNGLSTNITHHIGLSTGLGYSVLFDDFSEIKTLGRVGGILGIEYEMKVNGFWLSIGPEVQYLSGKSLFKATGTEARILDTYGVMATYHYNFDEGQDIQQMLFVSLPITLGYHYHGLYFGGGVKIGYGLFGNESTQLEYTTTGTYSDYIDDFRQIPNHSYSTYQSSAIQNTKNKIKISVIGEVGYDVLSWYRNQYHSITSGLKVSLYVEYGLNNLGSGNTDLPLYKINPSNAQDIQINPFYYSRAGNAHKIHPFFAGVKITWLMCVKTKTCNCYENEKYFNSRYKKMSR